VADVRLGNGGTAALLVVKGQQRAFALLPKRPAEEREAREENNGESVRPKLVFLGERRRDMLYLRLRRSYKTLLAFSGANYCVPCIVGRDPEITFSKSSVGLINYDTGKDKNIAIGSSIVVRLGLD